MELDDKAFKSITFFGKCYIAKHVMMIRRHPKSAGEELVHVQLIKTLPRQMKRLTPSGAEVLGLSCLSAPELLEQAGAITLEENFQSKQNFRPRIVHCKWAVDRSPINAT
ncbi:MAG: hypothetical protein OXF20_12940 [Gammaproteobacteria bacterium]|nr:hypothetical protein [Gammaproteobacteria bacterium]